MTSYANHFLRHLPTFIDTDAIQQQWQALNNSSLFRVEERHLPLPVWARRPFTEDGQAAWMVLQQDLPKIDANRAFCIYVHIPFCARKCSFCDCYSFRLHTHVEKHVTDYVERLVTEIDLWSSLSPLDTRPVSTIHLGGGTPTLLGATKFAELMQHLRKQFAIDEQTEWALESTTAELNDEMFDVLAEQQFTRLHIGVQSLDDGIRQRLKRQESASTTLRKIEQARQRGWVVTVDMIFGLPGQTPAILLDDLQTLTDVGVDGFSIYELQLSDHNKYFAKKHHLHTRSRVHNYLLGQIAAQQLTRLGFRKMLFNHYAGERDHNLYFTFPERGEDCLALGTIADGMFGDYHYRHPTYADYTRTVTAGFPGLQGGQRRTAIENNLHDLTTALLSGRIPQTLWAAKVPPATQQQWVEAQLVVYDDRWQHYHLTGNGSWFVGNMISALVNDAIR